MPAGISLLLQAPLLTPIGENMKATKCYFNYPPPPEILEDSIKDNGVLTNLTFDSTLAIPWVAEFDGNTTANVTYKRVGPIDAKLTDEILQHDSDFEGWILICAVQDKHGKWFHYFKKGTTEEI